MFSLCLHALLYFVPTMVAAHRGHRITVILLLNILFGWSIIGWFALLLWALLSAPGTRLYRYANSPAVDWRF